MSTAGTFLLKKEQKIVFDGDSNTSRRTPPSLDTWPFLRLMAWERTWADEFAETLFCTRPDLNLTFHNAAVGGSNIFDVLDRFDRFVAPHKPDWIFMSIGNNDQTQKIPLTKFSAGVDDFFRKVRANGKGKAAILGGPTNAGPRAPYYRVLQKAVNREKGLYIDFRTPLAVKGALLKKQHEAHTVFSDGGHLNNVGCRIVSGAVLAALGFSWG